MSTAAPVMPAALRPQRPGRPSNEVRIHRKREPIKRVVCLNEETEAHLETIRQQYGQMLGGRTPSVSLVVRRATEVLASRLQAVNEAGAQSAELAALAMLLA